MIVSLKELSSFIYDPHKLLPHTPFIFFPKQMIIGSMSLPERLLICGRSWTILEYGLKLKSLGIGDKRVVAALGVSVKSVFLPAAGVN